VKVSPAYEASKCSVFRNSQSCYWRRDAFLVRVQNDRGRLSANELINPGGRRDMSQTQEVMLFVGFRQKKDKGIEVLAGH
jgi:hypothetical protein